jgi:hypothetical protein
VAGLEGLGGGEAGDVAIARMRRCKQGLCMLNATLLYMDAADC